MLHKRVVRPVVGSMSLAAVYVWSPTVTLVNAPGKRASALAPVEAA